MKKQILLMTLILMMTGQTFADATSREDIKMVCTLEVSSSDGNQEILQSEQMYLTSKKSVVVAGQIGEVAFGYDRYKAFITNETDSTLVQLFDGKNQITFQRIPSYLNDFTVSGIIENLKFDKLNLNCAAALTSAH